MLQTTWTLFAAALCVAPASSAAELRPFSLPSQSAPPYVQQRAPSSVSNSYYDNFSREVAQMDQQKVDALRTEFQKQLAQAKSNKREDEQAHYQRMLGILEAYGKRSK